MEGPKHGPELTKEHVTSFVKAIGDELIHMQNDLAQRFGEGSTRIVTLTPQWVVLTLDTLFNELSLYAATDINNANPLAQRLAKENIVSMATLLLMGYAFLEDNTTDESG